MHIVQQKSHWHEKAQLQCAQDPRMQNMLRGVCWVQWTQKTSPREASKHSKREGDNKENPKEMIINLIVLF